MPNAQKVATRSGDLRPFEKMRDSLQSQAELEGTIALTDDEVFELGAAALDKIAVADDLDSIFDANQAASLPDVEAYLGRAQTLLEIAFNKSREQFKKGSLGVYAYVKAVLDDGEEVEYSCGAPNVVGSLYRIQELGLLSASVKPRIVISGKTTLSGNTLYRVTKP